MRVGLRCGGAGLLMPTERGQITRFGAAQRRRNVLVCVVTRATPQNRKLELWYFKEGVTEALL